MSTPKDTIKYELNPFTGEFDMISEFNADRIVTHKLNAAGNIRVTYDFQSGLWIPEDDAIVTANEGNVVVI